MAAIPGVSRGGTRLLVVIGDELLGGNDARDWAFLESLVAANSPDSIEVEIVALINEPSRPSRFSNPLGQALGVGADGTGPQPEPYNPSDRARQRLGRARQQLRSLGLHTTGDIGTGDP